MQTRPMMLAGVGVVAAIAIAAVMLRPEAPALETSIPAPEAAAVPLQDTTATAMSAPLATSETIPAEPTAPAVLAPLITDFRFEPDGGLLLSGTATPGAMIALVVDGAEVERMEAARNGSFVITGFLGYSAAPRRMVLIEDPDGAAMPADRTYVLDANPAPVVAEVSADAEVGQAGQAEAVAQLTETANPESGEPENAPTPAETATVAETAAAVETGTARVENPDSGPASVDAAGTAATPTILALGAEGPTVVQAPVAADTPPEVMSTVALDSISYDATGEVVLSGRAAETGFVQVYINNAPVSRPVIGEDGSWRTDLPDIDKGVYTLRIDEVNTAGDVVSRIETPFQREDPEDVAAVMADQTADPAFTIATRTVQPGATLWAIAEERYGSGVQYLTVFEANRDRIRDPDLIYPGQVFVIPEENN